MCVHKPQSFPSVSWWIAGSLLQCSLACSWPPFYQGDLGNFPEKSHSFYLKKSSAADYSIQSRNRH
ncbi:hypothetical protein KC19_4G258800 [Ceratodon purpureus]|uniref:Secreted protein n=1 Tax=Ceratodon purpureus TaxID=3225 RepID=A0A8T0IF44_CERPU|nr:hypothetical protein KC19_4G258800 [Ceratodon purpureus]